MRLERKTRFREQGRRNRISTMTGFTLIELMIVLAVFAILAAVAAPSMSRYLIRHRIGGAALDVLAAVREARMAAVERNRPVVFKIDKANGTFQTFVDDGAGGPDADANGVPDNAGNHQYDAGEQLIAATVLPTGVTFGADFSFHFDSRGFPLTSSNTLTSGTMNLSNEEGTTKQIALIISGHSKIQ